MINLKDALTSPIGKKVINSLSALGAVIFVIAHLAGNLTLFGGAEAFNAYGEKLHHLGGGIVLPILEIGLVVVFLLHIVSAIVVTLDNNQARSTEYAADRESKGGPSLWSLASTKMIFSGLILLVFLVVHLVQFRFRAYWDDAYGADYYHHLYEMVQVTFAGPNGPVWTVFYCGVMLFLGLHLRHGLWSMFQSIGAMNSAWKKSIYGLALILGVLLAVGFFVLPIYVLAFVPAP